MQNLIKYRVGIYLYSLSGQPLCSTTRFAEVHPRVQCFDSRDQRQALAARDPTNRGGTVNACPQEKNIAQRCQEGVRFSNNTRPFWASFPKRMLNASGTVFALVLILRAKQLVAFRYTGAIRLTVSPPEFVRIHDH